MKRRCYTILPITINDTTYTEVIIDPHYQENHAQDINDELILNLVLCLKKRKYFPEGSKGNFKYFVNILTYNNKRYRLIWLLETNSNYIGIINAFRDSKGE